MIENLFLVNEIEQELNEIAQTNGLKFKIHSAVGDYKDPILQQDNGTLQEYINGVFRMLDGQYASLSEIKDLFAEYLLEFAVRQEQKDVVESILQTWVYLRLGQAKIITEDGTSYIMTPTPPIPGVAKDSGKVGSMVTYSMNIKLQSIKNGLLSNMVHWFISVGGEPTEVKRIRSSITTVRTPNSKPIINENVMRTTNAYATNQLTLEVPYVNDNDVVKTIEQDIILGNKDQRYTISRTIDGISTQHDYVLSQGSINEEEGAVVGMQLTFSRA